MFRPALLTPRARGTISRQLRANGTWKGRRRGIPLKFKLDSQQLALDGNHVEWKAFYRGIWLNGRAPTVFAAGDQIDNSLNAVDLRKGT